MKLYKRIPYFWKIFSTMKRPWKTKKMYRVYRNNNIERAGVRSIVDSVLYLPFFSLPKFLFPPSWYLMYKATFSLRKSENRFFRIRFFFVQYLFTKISIRVMLELNNSKYMITNDYFSGVERREKSISKRKNGEEQKLWIARVRHFAK